MAYFATEYTIHFDDTMAYGSHHFLTAFKLQCASREAFLFGERVFDIPGVKEALDEVHLLTADAYSRNLHPAKLGDRLAIFLTLEEWGRASARFCYRVFGEQGQAVCAGFQTLICADASTQLPIPLPGPLQQAMDAMREIEEPLASESFRDRVLAGGSKLESVFEDSIRQLACKFLTERYPHPQVVGTELPANRPSQPSVLESASPSVEPTSELEAWFFAGQAACDGNLLSNRIRSSLQRSLTTPRELEQCAELAARWIGGDTSDLLSGSPEQCNAAIESKPALSQIAIHLQNVLGGMLWQADGHTPGVLMGHSFGEIAALGVSGCFDLQTGVQIVGMRVQSLMEHAPSDGGLLVASCDRSRASIEAELLGLDQLVVAGRNHAAQTLMSGPIHQLSQLKDYLLEHSISATFLPSATSFHHPHLRTAAMNWHEQLRTLQFQQPTIPVYSPIGRRFIKTSEDIAALLASQLVRPFDLQGAIAETVKMGVTKFIDCGSAGQLARLIAKSCSEDIEVCQVESPRQADSRELGLFATSECATATPANAATDSKHAHPPASHAQKSEAPSTKPHRPSTPSVDVSPPPIAIVSHGCILPGGARSPEQLFEAIMEQRAGILDQREFDAHWEEDFYAEKLTSDRTTSPLTGRVQDADITVPDGVDPAVFAAFTRTQKLICIALAPCAQSLEGAERVMCLLGATADGLEDQDEITSLRYAGIDPLDSRVRERLQLERAACEQPYEAVQQVLDRIVRPGLKITLVDAACASSLVTVALGMQALETGKADAVLTGGFFCPGPGNSCLFSQFRGTTSTGCRPFDAGADGVVFSEGAAIVTLRRLADAQRLGLDVKATVLGAGLSSDGKSSSANVPQSRGQILSLARCYDKYSIDPNSIMAIEAHGTSTPVGDSTELETLRQFFAERPTEKIRIHSLKGLLGHAGWAAGTASVIAVCQYMQHGIFPAQAMHRQPSEALRKAQTTLRVSTEPTSLPDGKKRIAIDGFGFGGANAHLVLESYSGDLPATLLEHATPLQHADESELVVVACHQESPTGTSAGSSFFDRQSMRLPIGYVVLPELADDMDISQKLAVVLADRILAQIPQLDEQLRRETAFVLALRGKTERGIEATMRILAPRFRRLLGDDQHTMGQLDRALAASRPSGTYTLQCMMPNVATGRGALLMDLNGPNFVVDAGPRSLEAAFESAALLLESGDKAGCKLAIVGDLHLNAYPRQIQKTPAESEYAVAFAVTTRRFAERNALPILIGMDAATSALASSTHEVPEVTPLERVRKLISALDPSAGKNTPETRTKVSEIQTSAKLAEPATGRVQSDARAPITSTSPVAADGQIHVPDWVESPFANAAEKATHAKLAKSVFAIAPAGSALAAELLAVLPAYCDRFELALVGDINDTRLPVGVEQPVMRVDCDDPQSISFALDRLDQFAPELIIALDRPTTWKREDSLARLAEDNSLGEFLFLASQRQHDRLLNANVELWGVVLDGWNGEAHPASGPITGLLKSIQREFSKSRTGTICSRGLDIGETFARLCAERWEPGREQEIIYDNSQRLIRRLRPASKLTACVPGVRLDKGSVVVASGGAKGVTAVMLEAIVQDYGCTVIAIGRSPLEAGPANFDSLDAEQDYYARLLQEHPEITAREMKSNFQSARASWEAHRTIQQLAANGGRVEYIEADITDVRQLERAIADIVSRHGKIDLLLHGAGVQKSKRLQDRSLADFRETFAVKVRGMHNLAACCQRVLGHSVSTHVLTSAYSIFGNDGQHDYGAANETLDRLCALDASSAQSDQWSSIAWLAWAGVGMTRGSEYAALAKRRGLSGVDRELGQRIFRDVMAGRTGSSINVPMSALEHREYCVRTIPAATTAEPGRVLESRVTLASIDCLPFHKVRNTPTLPGAWILELLVRTGVHLAPSSEHLTNLTIEDTSFARFVRFSNNQEPNVRVVAEQAGNAIDVWMLADVLHPSGVVLSTDVLCASARIQFGSAGIASSISAGGSERVKPRNFVKDPYCDSHKEVALSGPFDCLSDIEINASNRRAKFTPDRSRTSSDTIPALLLDAAWRVGAMYAVAGKDDVFVPVSIGKMVFPQGMDDHGLDLSSWEILSTTPRSDDRNVRWDRTEVFDQSGQLKLVVEDALATQLL